LCAENLQTLEQAVYTDIINQLDVSLYKNQRVIIKGCSKHVIPENAYIQLIQKIQPFVQSIFFGEACSTVPLYKKNKL
jgi:ribosomal protein L6P/L9E